MRVFQFLPASGWGLIGGFWPFERKAPPLTTLEGGVPILLGVTGSRDIDPADPRLRLVIEEECLALRRRYPSTPFVVLSGLAEGADRLVAKIAMEKLSATLIAVLATPRADFVSDFTSQASRNEFDTLLAQAESVVEIETPDGDGWKHPGALRNVQHAKAGAAIAEHSQILFALCDDQEGREPGCAQDVVAWRLQGYAPKHYSFNAEDISPLDPPTSGLVIRINPSDGAVTRLSAGGRSSETTARRRLPRRLAEFDWLLYQTEWFNKSVIRNQARIANARSLVALPENAPPERREAAARAIAAAPEVEAVYRASDTLSVHLARTVRRADRGIYALAVLAFCLFNMLEKAPLSALAYFAIASAMVALWAAIHMLMIENRFLEYRALAEAMRVLFFWRLTGVPHPVWLGYLSKHSGVVLWVRHAICAVEFRDVARRTGGNLRQPQPFGESESLALAEEHWINGQLEFFSVKGAFHNRQRRRWTWAAGFGLGASYLLALVLLAWAIARWPDVLGWDGAPQANLVPWLQAALGVAAAIGLAARGYVFRRADYELFKQYKAERRIFELARAELNLLSHPKSDGWDAKDILARLGGEALTEHGEWLWLRHSRPFDVPQ